MRVPPARDSSSLLVLGRAFYALDSRWNVGSEIVDVGAPVLMDDGQAWGNAGAYHRIDGTIYFALNTVLTPADVTRGNGIALGDIAIRGTRTTDFLLNHATSPENPFGS